MTPSASTTRSYLCGGVFQVLRSVLRAAQQSCPTSLKYSANSTAGESGLMSIQYGGSNAMAGFRLRAARPETMLSGQRMWRVCRRAKRQSGSAMVELSLIWLPMFALFFGIMDFSLAIFLESTFEQAAREGVRFATTFQSSYNGQDCTASEATCITQVVKDNSVGFLSGKDQYIFVNYYTAKDLTNPVETCNLGTCAKTGTLPQTLSSGVKVNFANQSGNIVEVVIKNYPYLWMVPIHVSSPTSYMPNISPGSGLTLNASSLDVLGGLAPGQTQPGP